MFRELKEYVRDKGLEDRQWAYEEALDAGVDMQSVSSTRTIRPNRKSTSSS